jgi:tRNA A-37 threonylcarbamoyl transferase component Bud32
VSTDSAALEATLRDLASVGTLVKDRGYRQVWRFEHQGRPYYAKFFPRTGPRDAFRRLFRGSPAMMEFTRLQRLQTAGVPAPRAVGVMMGFRHLGPVGDLVILDAIEPAVALDQYLLDLDLRGEPVPDRLGLAAQVRAIVLQLGRARLGHEDLHLGNFLLSHGKLFLLDGYAVRLDGMRMRDLQMLGHSSRRWATTADLQRGWNQLGPGGPMPKVNPLSRTLWDRFLGSVTRKGRYFGRLTSDAGWGGVYYKQTKYPHRWSAASQLDVAHEDWAREWPLLLGRIERGELPVLKRSRSGDVLSATVTLGGRPLDVIVKRPKRKHWYRYVNEVGRGSRAWRAWRKAWQLVVRDLPTAWPLLVMHRRVAGYPVDAIYVSERVPGDTLAHADLSGLADEDRENLFRRVGRTLREIERHGFSHFDAKASNFIVLPDERVGPVPVLIDVDGIRRRNWVALGVQRLLRSMHENPHYAPPDSLALCQGYAPRARLGEELFTTETRRHGEEVEPQMHTDGHG